MSWEPLAEAKDIAIAALCRALGHEELQRVIIDLERHPGLRGPHSDDFLEAANLLAVELRGRG